MIVLKLNVVQRDAAKIGDPVDVSSAGSAPPAAAPSYAAPPPQQPPQHQQHAYQQPPPASYGGGYGGGGAPPAGVTSGAVAPADPGAVYQPIDSLNPYQNRWTIKARITSKGDMKSWNNARGSGTLFKIELLDERG